MANDLDLKVRISAEIKQLQQSLDRVQSELVDVGKSAKRGTDEAAAGISKLESTAAKAGAAIAGYFSAQAFAGLAQSIIKTADEYQQLVARLRLVTSSSEELEQVQARLFDISQRTSSSLAATTDLYTRLARSSQQLGVSQEELARITETVNKAIGLSGASAESAEAALIQLGQGLASGALRGEELTSVLEQTPRLARAIADGLGVAVGSLKDLGAEGQLTADRVVAALLKTSEAVDAEFSKLPDSVGRSLTRLRNEVTQAVGQTDLTPLVASINQLSTTLSDPAILSNLSSLAAGIVNITALAAEAASEFADLGNQLGFFAASIVGNVSEADKLERKLRDIDKALKNSALGTPINLLGKSREELQAEREELQRQLDVLARAQGFQTTGEREAARKAETERLAQALREKAEADLKSAQAAAESKAAEEAARKAEEDRQDSIRGLLKNLNESAATYGKTSEEVAIYRLRKLGATEAEIAFAEEVREQIKALKAREEAEKQAIENAKEAERLAEERARKEAELADQILAVRARLAAAQGNDVEARRIELEAQYGQLIADLEAKGDQAGVNLVRKLINLEESDAQLAQLEEKIKRSLENLANTEESVGNQILAGAIEPAQGRQQIEASRAKTIEDLRTYRAELQQLAESDLPGVEEQITELDRRIEGLNAQSITGLDKAVQGLRANLVQMGDDLAKTATSAAVDSLTTAFTDIATGAVSAEEGIKNFARSFAQSMLEVAARALATYAVLQLLNIVAPGSGTLAGAGASVQHRGGLAGRSAMRRSVSPLLFVGAPRYHAGGVAGLAPNEVPAILQKGEEVLARNDPRNVMNGGGQGGTRVVNVIDPNMVQDYLSSSGGEQVLVNVIQRNAGMIKQVLG